MSTMQIPVPILLSNRPFPAGTVECDNCQGDGVVNGTCSCGRCESPPDERCPVCGGRGYMDAPNEDDEDS